MNQKIYSFLSSDKFENLFVTGLRLSLALIFIWFGFLKVFGYDPVADLVLHSMVPSYVSGGGLLALGILEVVIGMLILSNQFLLMTYTILCIHMLGTFSTFIYSWEIMFSPHFPILTMSGEFVVKNLTLIFAGFVIFAHEAKRKQGKDLLVE